MVKNFKYILKRILIGVGIALVLMMIKDKSFILSANAKTYTLTPDAQTFTRSDTGVTYNQPLSRFTFNKKYPNVYFNGFVSSDSVGYWSYAQWNYDIPNDLKKGYYNVDFLFYNSWQSGLDNTYTFTTYFNNMFTSCTSSASNIGNSSSSAQEVKNVISVKCENLYLDREEATRFFINVFPNNAKSYGNTLGCSDIKLSYLPSNGQQEVAEAQQETNNILSDDDIDEESTTTSLGSLSDKNASNGSITQLLTLPITLFQSVLNSVSGSCSSFNLGNLLGTNLTMPCINLQSILGSTLYNIIDILLCGLFILVFRKKMVDIFNHMTSLNDRGNEVE